jgi:hypothetical protein
MNEWIEQPYSITMYPQLVPLALEWSKNGCQYKFKNQNPMAMRRCSMETIGPGFSFFWKGGGMQVFFLKIKIKIFNF